MECALLLASLLFSLRRCLQTRAALHAENLALRHQLLLLQRVHQNRLIGSIRRECLDHFIVFHERGLHRALKSYFEYYEQSRTHFSLDKDVPLTRAIHPPEMGRVIALPQVGGLHHRYERRAA